MLGSVICWGGQFPVRGDTSGDDGGAHVRYFIEWNVFSVIKCHVFVCLLFCLFLCLFSLNVQGEGYDILDGMWDLLHDFGAGPFPTNSGRVYTSMQVIFAYVMWGDFCALTLDLACMFASCLHYVLCISTCMQQDCNHYITTHMPLLFHSYV